MVNQAPTRSRPLRLEVPLDASGVTDFRPEMPVKVVLASGEAQVLASTTVELNDRGSGIARFELDQALASARIIVGPGDADDEELIHLQTISRALPPRALRGAEQRLVVAPVIISDFYWWWWRRWCRRFVIRGRVVCPDGSPVPGATVCAYDVDWWWWWSSSQQVGCATTDANGAFTIHFRWCCGWWPWWWWRLRHWAFEPRLAERIRPLLERVPNLKAPAFSSRPNLDLFESILAENGVARVAASPEVDLAQLPALRDQLVVRLPAAPELANLRIWPWWPWHPWWDCTPDIIFKVRQRCRGEEQLIVNEGFWDVRWNIPTVLDVTLTATDEACCIPDNPPPEGNCIVLSKVCSSLVNQIGGNPGSPAGPTGYLNPVGGSTSSHRPFAGIVPIEGLFGNLANVDYYKFQVATAPMGPWSNLPPAAQGGFTRWFWGPALGGGPIDFHPVSFTSAVVGGQLVIESREHFEATVEAGSWGFTRFWTSGRDQLVNWLTENNFADGTYYLRLVGYELTGADTLGPEQILPLCDTDNENGLVVTLDNIYNPALEPEADIVDVRINGASAGPCSNIDARNGGVLEVDFVAYDVDRHLAWYSLIATYGKNLAVNLLTVPGAGLTPVALGAIPPADFAGPDYAAAQSQGAPAPYWRAGGLRLTIPDLRNAFPETCCYQLELRVYKRTIVSCNYNYTPNKLSYYSLTVVV
jgi:hypothetical protein